MKFNFSPTSAADTHSHGTRSATSGNFYLPRAFNEVFKRSLSYRGPSVWAAVPNHLKTLDTPVLKRKLKDYLLSLYDEQEVDQLTWQHSV